MFSFINDEISLFPYPTLLFNRIWDHDIYFDFPVEYFFLKLYSFNLDHNNVCKEINNHHICMLIQGRNWANFLASQDAAYD